MTLKTILEKVAQLQIKKGRQKIINHTKER